MTDKRISELDVAENTGYDDLQPIVQEGTTKQLRNILADYDIANVVRPQISSMAVKFGNAAGSVGVSGIEFWYNGVKQAVPDAMYLMYKDSNGSLSNSSPSDTNLVGSLSNLFDDDSATCIKYDCTFVNELTNPDREDLYLYFQWFTYMPFFDEVRVVAASGGDFDVDETPERVAYYMDGDFSLEKLVAQFYVGDPDDILSWSDGETKTFTVPAFYMPKVLAKDGYFFDDINVNGANGEYISADYSNQNVTLLSGEILVHRQRNVKINHLRKQTSFIDTSVTFNEAYILDGNGPVPVYLVDTTSGSVTITIPPPTDKLRRLNLSFEGADMKFINVGTNNLIIANSGFAHFKHKGTASTPSGGQLTVFVNNDYLIVTGDTT